jgi:hypothetical protein
MRLLRPGCLLDLAAVLASAVAASLLAQLVIGFDAWRAAREALRRPPGGRR